MRPRSYVDFLGSGGKGNGLFAIGTLPEGVVVAEFGGEEVPYSSVTDADARYALLVGRGNCVIDKGKAGMANHSCVPNCDLIGRRIVTNRTVSHMDELTFAYEMLRYPRSSYSPEDLEWDPRWSFDCACGSAVCRGVVSGFVFAEDAGPLGDRPEWFVGDDVRFGEIRIDGWKEDVFCWASFGSRLEDPGVFHYRYQLVRSWDVSLPRCLFVMLNPSTADRWKTENDRTVRKCMGFARAWGFGSIEIVNLFGWMSSDPSELRTEFRDPIGRRNDEAILMSALRAGKVVCAWGNGGSQTIAEGWKRSSKVRDLLNGIDLFCIKVNDATGEPAHPLYLKGDLLPRVLT